MLNDDLGPRLEFGLKKQESQTSYKRLYSENFFDQAMAESETYSKRMRMDNGCLIKKDSIEQMNKYNGYKDNQSEEN